MDKGSGHQVTSSYKTEVLIEFPKFVSQLKINTIYKLKQEKCQIGLQTNIFFCLITNGIFSNLLYSFDSLIYFYIFKISYWFNELKKIQWVFCSKSEEWFNLKIKGRKGMWSSSLLHFVHIARCHACLKNFTSVFYNLPDFVQKKIAIYKHLSKLKWSPKLFECSLTEYVYIKSISRQHWEILIVY